MSNLLVVVEELLQVPKILSLVHRLGDSRYNRNSNY